MKCLTMFIILFSIIPGCNPPANLSRVKQTRIKADEVSALCSMYFGEHKNLSAYKFKMDSTFTKIGFDSILNLSFENDNLIISTGSKLLAKFGKQSAGYKDQFNNPTFYAYAADSRVSLSQNYISFYENEFHGLVVSVDKLDIIMIGKHGYHCTNHKEIIHTCSMNPAFASPPCITSDCVWAKD